MSGWETSGSWTREEDGAGVSWVGHRRPEEGWVGDWHTLGTGNDRAAIGRATRRGHRRGAASGEMGSGRRELRQGWRTVLAVQRGERLLAFGGRAPLDHRRVQVRKLRREAALQEAVEGPLHVAAVGLPHHNRTWVKRSRHVAAVESRERVTTGGACRGDDRASACGRQEEGQRQRGAGRREGQERAPASSTASTNPSP